MASFSGLQEDGMIRAWDTFIDIVIIVFYLKVELIINGNK